MTATLFPVQKSARELHFHNISYIQIKRTQSVKQKGFCKKKHSLVLNEGVVSQTNLDDR